MAKLHTFWAYAFSYLARALQNPSVRRVALKATLLATRQIINYAANQSTRRAQGHYNRAKNYYSG